jgi:hypothetical protein
MRVLNAIAVLAAAGALTAPAFAHTALPLAQSNKSVQPFKIVPAASTVRSLTGLTAGRPAMLTRTGIVDAVAPLRNSAISKSPVASKVQNDPPGILLGETFYDLQTNGSMPQRIKVYKEGNDVSAQVIWMAATDEDRNSNPPHPTRGSYYALLDVKNPTDPKKYNDVTWQRIEGSVRSGFPSIIQFKDGSVGSIAHIIGNQTAASVLRFTRNTSFGDANFTSSIIPGSDSAIWAHSLVDESDNIHVLFTSDTSSKNYSEQVVYMRSTDKGKTWSEPKYISGPQSNPTLPTGRGANAYQLATRGNTLAIGYQDTTFNLIILKSNDLGVTWEQPRLIFGGSRHQNATILEDFGDGTFRATTDTVPICGSSFDLILDTENNVHAIASASPSWKSGIAQRNSQNEIEFLPGGDTTFANLYTRVAFVYYSEAANQYGFMTMNEDWDGQGTVVTRQFGNGICRYPMLGLDESNNTLYLTYTGIKNEDVLETVLANGESALGLFGHIYVAKKDLASETWDVPIDVTVTGWDCQFSAMYPKVSDGVMMLTYQADQTPGVSIQNTNQAIESNRVLFYSLRPSFVSVQEGSEQNAAAASLTISPNPATDMATISFGAGMVNASVKIYNALGEQVAEMPSELSSTGMVNVSTAQFPAGTYYCTLRAGSTQITRLFNVVR